MRLPSYKASFIAGVVCMPLLELVLNFIDANYSHVPYVGISKFIIIIFLFLVPVILATADITYFKRKYNRYVFIRMDQITKSDFKDFHIPAIKRMCVWFFGGAISIIAVNLIKNISNLWL